MAEEEDNFPPRDYQVALREVAIKQNTIIYLPTGSGKTFIAVLVLKQMQQSRPKYSEGGKISFVVVNTVALVDQHANCIEKRTSFDVGRYSGEMGVDFWPKSVWYKEFDKFQVLVMTVQILVNLTNQNFLDLNKVNLIVFDECHRGVNDQPMRQLCKSFENVREQPRILGLTATLLNGNCKPNRVLTEVEKLEVTYHSKVATVDGLARVSGYSTNPKEYIVTYSDHNPQRVEAEALKLLGEMILILSHVKEPKVDIPIPRIDLKPLGKEEGLRKLNNSISDIKFHISSMGLYGGSKAILAHMIQIERMKRHCDEATLHQVLCYVQTTLCILKKMFDRAMDGYEGVDKIFRFSSDKIVKLINIINTYKERSQEELCAIVFTQRRFTAKVIYYILDSLSKISTIFAHIKPNFMVGYNLNPFNDTRELLFTSKKNRETLQSFDNKETNILCASNVLEEGVDITTCSLVIKYDHPEEYRSYIQSKGRARNPASLYYMMVERSKAGNFTERYREFQEVENTLQNLLIGQNELRKEPSAREIENMYREDGFPPYYVDGPNSARVDMVSAISLLCQYCNALPCDKYTSLTPDLYYKEEITALKEKLTSVTIVLPTISPLREPIQGPFMTSLKLAKRAAALITCERLHKMGELDNHLLPRRYVVADEDVNFLFKHYPDVKEDMAGANTKKRLHKKQIAKFLKGPVTPNKTAWLHTINLQPVFEKRDEINFATFYDIYTSNLCYGFVTPNAVPSICDFPIYVTMGTINVQLRVNVVTVSLTEEDMTHIREFNFNIYNDILNALKVFLIFDNGDNAETMLMVPVDKSSGTIDFKVLRENRRIKDSWVELTSDERMNLNVTQEDYLRKIVSPWYRDMGRVFFLVTKIENKQTAKSNFPNPSELVETNKKRKLSEVSAEDKSLSSGSTSNYVVTEVTLSKSAKSEFPNEQFATYEDYYKEKHSVRLLNPTQPLLYVKQITKKLNFIKPIGAQAKRKKEKNYEELDIHLIPELVVKQDFPSALWVQAGLLPTIISRFAFLFRLEELRNTMATEMKIGNPALPKKPLELDDYLLNYTPHLENPVVSNVLVSEPKVDFVAPVLSSINVNKDYAKKMLEMEYPWKDSEEPKDIERDLNVTILDIDYYESFTSRTLNFDSAQLKNDIPKRQKDHQLALTYYKNYEEKPIKLLQKNDLKVGPELFLIYKAMTTAKANDIVNMERLETLGDSFLKIFGSLYVYFKFPRFSEGQATSLKGRLVSNKNLYYLAERKNIGGIMKINDLQISDWLPPCFKVPDLIEERINAKDTSLASLYKVAIPIEEQITGNLSVETIKSLMSVKSEEEPSEEGLIQDIAPFFKSNYVGDKKVADCVEALLGAYFQSCGILGGLRFMEWMGIIPKSENLLQILQQRPENPILNDKATIADINYHIPDWQIIEDNILGYHFKNRAFLLQALTHSSYTPNRITHSYERLEFLGDAILDFLITCHIFESCGNLDPGQLTDLRSALVNNNTFASLVVRHNLHKYMLMINIKLQGMIDRFAGYIESKKFEIDDEVLILLEEEDADGLNLAEYIDVPKVLGDIFEALAGAVYLDSGGNLEVVWKVFHRIMWNEIDRFSSNVPKNLVRRLYEWTPNLYPRFDEPKNAQQGKVMVSLQFMLNGRYQQVYGFGSNKIMARKAAAKLALRQKMMRYEEENETLKDKTPCAGVRADLKMCLLESECCRVLKKTPRECLRTHDGTVPDECMALRNTFFECKRSMLDARQRFRGRKGY